MYSHDLAKHLLGMPNMQVFISNPENAPAPLKELYTYIYSPKGYDVNQTDTHISMLDLSVEDVYPKDGDSIIVL